MKAAQYNRINALLEEYSSTQALLERAEADIKTRQLKAAKTLLPRHAKLKTRLTEIESELRAQAKEHESDLFADDLKRKHRTPFGEIGFHKSTRLDIKDEETTLSRIRSACAREATEASDEKRDPRFTISQLVRIIEEPRLEALETLDDATLKELGIKRTETDNFKVKPFAMQSDKPARTDEPALKEAA